MEDFLTTGATDLTGKYVWINNFLMWMQSPIFKANWTKISFNYSKDTREMIERLILESDKLIQLRKEKGNVSSADYDAVSTKFEVVFR